MFRYEGKYKERPYMSNIISINFEFEPFKTTFYSTNEFLKYAN